MAGFRTTDTVHFKSHTDRYPDLIKILAEGDSWFAYPRKFFLFGEDSNILHYLDNYDDLAILSLASNGDEIVDMASGDQKFSLLKVLSHIPFDFLLLSGGGNDIVGRYDFGFFLNQKNGDMYWKECINEYHFRLKLTQIRSIYEELILRVREIPNNSGIKIITHTYDIPIPSTEGYEFLDIIPSGRGPWMYPYFHAKNIKDHEDQKKIARYLLEEFKNELLLLADKPEYRNCFYVVDTQGTVSNDQWRDEIHPTPEGFAKIASKVYKEGIKQHLVFEKNQ